MNTTEPVLFDTISARGGYRIGILTLNRPEVLHALDLTMVQAIARQMQRWQRSKRVVAVFLQGGGDRAFSAGGDLRQLYASMTAEDNQRYDYADRFFLAEYLNILNLHRFTKPLIAWGNGLLMGGGLGLYLAASHRVVTASVQMAWPEVRIGLFPDVMGSWYLSRLPEPLGRWLGMSGSALNDADAKAEGLAGYRIDHNGRHSVIEDLRRLRWGDNHAANHFEVRQCLRQAEQEHPCYNQRLWPLVSAQVAACVDAGSGLLQTPLVITGMEDAEALAWFEKGWQQVQEGCPMSVRLVNEQIRLGLFRAQGEVMAMELEMAWHCTRSADFAEGIRGRLLERTVPPQWQDSHAAEVSAESLRQMLTSPWSDSQHPFRSFLRQWERG